MKALLVDLDDTLLDYSGGIDVTWREACEAVAVPSGAEVLPLVAAIAAARRWFWDESGRHREGRRDMLGAWTTIAGLGLERVGLAVPSLAAAIAQDYATRRRATYRLLPGAWEGLIELRRRGMPLALVTNGDAREQRYKIERFELAQFFDVIVVEGEFGAGKPEEAVYHHAVQALGVPHTSSWMVGDHLEWDVAAPQRLGLTGVWVDAPGNGVPADLPVKPDRIFRTFADFVAGC
jgi:putative hydrolase of the HAD superfamily